MTDVFDDMLRRSIPQYEVMRAATARVASMYVSEGGRVLDIGCSRGRSISAAMEACPASATFVGVDVSEAMIAAASRDLAEAVASGRVLLHHGGIEAADRSRFDVVQAVLTLQFIPIEHRLAVVEHAYSLLRRGGALIVVEKLLGGSAEVQHAFEEEYHALKRRNGYSAEQVAAKAKSLEGALVALPELALREWLLRRFRSVECFWRWFNFAAFVAVK